MLAPNQILSYTNAQTLTKNILTEYYQHELLQSLFTQKNSEYFSFIGGTAIRICYGGKRFSEDLDFDTTHLDLFDELLQNTIKHMEAKGFVIEPRLIHKGAYHCYLKFPHILKTLGLSGYHEEKLLIKVDAATTDHFMTQNHLLNNYGVFQEVKVAPQSVLLSKKLLTIMSRKRPKGRDLYDVTYLWGLTEPSMEYIEKVGQINLPQLLKELSTFTKKLNLTMMVAEVSPFLTNPQDTSRVLHFTEFIKQKTQKS